MARRVKRPAFVPLERVILARRTKNAPVEFAIVVREGESRYFIDNDAIFVRFLDGKKEFEFGVECARVKREHMLWGVLGFYKRQYTGGTITGLKLLNRKILAYQKREKEKEEFFDRFA